MSDLKHAGSFRDLIVYQKSRQLQRNVLNSMMDKADMFCGEPPRALREEAAVYFIESDDDKTDD